MTLKHSRVSLDVGISKDTEWLSFLSLLFFLFIVFVLKKKIVLIYLARLCAKLQCVPEG